ncbi:hypothetical protein ACFSTE_09035 [Aquimarina hainanensis]|uniref:Uncharacterized protein n=1 Tax=Aquimarina hainanensis TaxID=1578017 RepID=A0ABW5N8N4_9FLAO|nr:hypothetical protein [Aquimarina sp. TRL1]QKX03867.1 hypothetical protein HN014_02750 [Aquimarina sp. TRL1]
METRNKLIVLWILLLIGMMLHFNYHISGVFYGIDIKRPDANGEEPASIHIIRGIYYHLPFLWIVILLYTKRRITHYILLVISVLYTLSHGMHLFEEISGTSRNFSQLTLLSIVLVVSLISAVEHYRLTRNN